jgi:hypothetical protein
VLVEVGSDIDSGSLDRLKEHLGNTWLLDVDKVGLKHALGCFETLGTDLDDPTIRKLSCIHELVMQSQLEIRIYLRCKTQRGRLSLLRDADRDRGHS